MTEEHRKLAREWLHEHFPKHMMFRDDKDVESLADLLRKVRLDIAENHFRCKNCGKCVCQHSDKTLKDLSPTLAEYQKHIAALSAPVEGATKP